jgi:aryl-alcohol dehydrogenase-like predicted oxidoreductase
MNIGIIARVPLDEGGLSGTLTKETRFPEKDWRTRYFGPENLGPTVERADALKKITPRGMDLPEMALRFILANQIISTTIPGMRTPSHVEKNISYSDGQGLPQDLLNELKDHRWDREGTPWSD